MSTDEIRNMLWLQGYNAMWAGAKVESCPYENETDEAETWFEGYMVAFEEKYDGDREPQ